MTHAQHPYNPLAIENLAESIVTQLTLVEAVPMRDIEHFRGAGCYAIYYTGENLLHPAYARLAALNTRGGDLIYPIYVGKAIPSGGRKGIAVATGTSQPALYGRLKEHRESIEAAINLDVDDFYARWLTLDNVWIPLGESLLISRYTPVWNALVDGFGNHNPGRERATGLRSRWDTIHPGRTWANVLRDRPETGDDIANDIAEYLRSRIGDIGYALG